MKGLYSTKPIYYDAPIENLMEQAALRSPLNLKQSPPLSEVIRVQQTSLENIGSKQQSKKTLFLFILQTWHNSKSGCSDCHSPGALIREAAKRLKTVKVLQKSTSWIEGSVQRTAPCRLQS